MVHVVDMGSNSSPSSEEIDTHLNSCVVSKQNGYCGYVWGLKGTLVRSSAAWSSRSSLVDRERVTCSFGGGDAHSVFSFRTSSV